MKNNPEMLPCPWCGHAPEIIIKTNPDYVAPTGLITVSFSSSMGESIACVNPQCPMQPYTHPAGPGNIHMFYWNWNTRTQPSVQDVAALNSRVDVGDTQTHYIDRSLMAAVELVNVEIDRLREANRVLAGAAKLAMTSFSHDDCPGCAVRKKQIAAALALASGEV